MKLYCVRHGHAEQLPNKSGERPLTQKGIEEINRIATYLAYRDVHAIHVMHSGKLRAQQSAVILAEAVAKNQLIEVCELLGSDHQIALLIDRVQEWHDDTLLVGHMPCMSQLVNTLILGDDYPDILRFTPATVVCLEQFENRWILNWVLRPDLVPHQMK
ncbi:phosphohistidine phosphatase SixA [Coxiella endosymbiont of Amblyomma nuttalli]|uniref:phosphohistidine phosphatase SixA n=1 Tax=Coxiella endosymbiont of Amblyomma nuttalli TaxID=2749996 RepID=UPI001BA8A019|nr:phosphohistidine phosphatase SixA [Coxiella endosymbiont of Amblyomma nuttalli]QTS83742.1 Phosphohistidine phosphatase SixA [Coxiella endosymbiont of Amblyomma nuttalli]